MPDNHDPDPNPKFRREGEAFVLSGIDEIKREQERQNTSEKEYREHDKGFKDRQIKLNAWLVTLTGALVFLGVLGMFLSIWQSWIAQRAATAAEIAADTATKALRQTERLSRFALSENRWLISESISQNERLTGESLKETGKANVAAQRAAKAAESANSLATESFRQEQRADLYVSKFVLGREPDDTDDRTTVVVTLSNNGRTAATKVHNFASYGYSVAEPPPGSWATLPEVHPTVIYPTGTYNVPVLFAKFNHPVTKTPLTAEQMKDIVKLYRAGKLRIYLRLRTEYRDIFDRQRWAEACVFRVFGQKPESFFFCDTGNDFSR